jgi:hypothetical protein
MCTMVRFLLALAFAIPSVCRAEPGNGGQILAPQVSAAQPIALRPVAVAAGRVIMPRPAGQQAVAADPSSLCDTAITTAEYVARLPARLLGAIALTESGRPDPVSGRLRAWPWTINAEGEGRFFPTRLEAIEAVKELQARGVRSIDVGCMQVNLMFHPDAFTSLEDAFDPRSNAHYAARFLNRLSDGGKDWTHAIAAYHSETPALGDAYRVLVMARWQNGSLAPVAAVTGQGAYQAFSRDEGRYNAFQPRSAVYGAFAPR